MFAKCLLLRCFAQADRFPSHIRTKSFDSVVTSSALELANALYTSGFGHMMFDVPNARVQILRKSAKHCKAKILVFQAFTGSMEIRTLLYDVASPAVGEKNQKVDCCRQNDTWTPFSSIALLRREMRFDMQCWRWQCLILSSKG